MMLQIIILDIRLLLQLHATEANQHIQQTLYVLNNDNNIVTITIICVLCCYGENTGNQGWVSLKYLRLHYHFVLTITGKPYNSFQ